MNNFLEDIGGAVTSLNNLLGTSAASNDPKNEVSLIVGGKQISGWTRVRITKSIEHIPNSFEIEFTENYTGAAPKVTVLSGAACQIKIGTDLLLSGYVDNYNPSFDADSHSIKITGRGKCQDLVDCSAEWQNGQISGTSAADIASKLTAPYGIGVTQNIPASAEWKPIAIPQFNLIYGETAAEILERICRFSALLYYEDENGNLVLSQVGANTMASGFSEGMNIQRASASFPVDQRYSEYDVALQSMATFNDVGNQGNLLASVTDPGVSRHRKKIIVCEAGFQGQDISKQRAQWELTRRAGRAWRLELTTDSWRDSAGALWQPNSGVTLNVPSMKIVDRTFIIGEVTFSRDEETGTTAQLVLMPSQAFAVQPQLIQQQPIVEAGASFNVPGGNQNPAAPNLPAAATSPAVSPNTGNYSKAQLANQIATSFGGKSK